MAKELPPVEFIVAVEKDVNAQEVINGLERLASGIEGFYPERLKLQDFDIGGRINLQGTTDAHTYEKLFKCTVKYDYAANKWRELTRAVTPDESAKKIRYIYLHDSSQYTSRRSVVAAQTSR